MVPRAWHSLRITIIFCSGFVSLVYKLELISRDHFENLPQRSTFLNKMASQFFREFGGPKILGTEVQ
jgi:hypothetical protein